MSSSSSTEQTKVLPHIVDGKTFSLASEVHPFSPNPSSTKLRGYQALGATAESCHRSVESAAAAFPKWKATHPSERQRLFLNLAKLLEDSTAEIDLILTEELGCCKLWRNINIQDSIGLLYQVAALTTSGILGGTSPVVADPDAHAVVTKEPLGVVLGIAPWNAPLILAFRAVAAAVAAGNTAILKGSELSPRTHYFVARLFQEAGFPPGVVNFLVHRPEDAETCFEALISHPSVRKCNFTGSTGVGRQIAMKAAAYIKPVLLELGGKNFSIVLADADLEKAATKVLIGAFLNTGQICMSTDLVLVSRKVERAFRPLLHAALNVVAQEATTLINPQAAKKVRSLLEDAKVKGAHLHSAEGSDNETLNPTIIEDVDPTMDFWLTESFGPVIGIRVFDEETDVPGLVNESAYGLSAAIFSRDTLRALKLGKQLEVGGVHINSPTVHDEAQLPHGGVKQSGWGRFGSSWGMEEFLQTKTIIMHS